MQQKKKKNQKQTPHNKNVESQGKENFLKIVRKKIYITNMEISITLITDFQTEENGGQKIMVKHSQSAKEKEN